MTAPKISKDVSDLLDPDWAKDKPDAEDSLVPVTPRKPDPTKSQSELDSLLTPRDLLDVVDPLAGTIGELVPDDLRGGDEEEDEFKTATAKTPDAKESDSREAGITLGEWIEKQAKDQTEKTENEKFEREIESRKAEDENREIRESFKRVFAARDAVDLTPDNLK